MAESTAPAVAWDRVRTALGAVPQRCNLGRLATAYPLAQGLAEDHALVWYGADGEVVRWTYRELDAAAARVAAWFLENGLQPGDRVVFLLPVLPELFAGVLGALRAGAVVGTLPPGRNVEPLRNLFLRARPKFAVAMLSFRNIFAAIKGDVSGLSGLLYVERRTSPPVKLEGVERFWGTGMTAAQGNEPERGLEDRALLNFSEFGQAGTVLGHMAAVGLRQSVASALRWAPREAVVSALIPGEPLFNLYHLVGPFLAGATLVCHEDPARFQRHADVAAELAPKSWISSFRALDVMMRTDPNLGTLLKPCTSIVVTHPADPGFLTMTSLSFGAPVRTAWTPREVNLIQALQEEANGGAGRPAEGCAVRIVDDHDRELRPGVTGTVCVRLGPAAPVLEFWEEPELTKRRVRDGWFHTGLRGRLDEKGALWLAG